MVGDERKNNVRDARKRQTWKEGDGMPRSDVVVALGSDRGAATRAVVKKIGLPNMNGKKVLIKPNCNTADIPPGSTHTDTLRTIVQMIKEGSPNRVVVGDRSGPANARRVFQDKGVFALADEMGFECTIFDEMPNSEYERIVPPDSHWKNGFLFAKPVLEADAVITLCCLKTHQYGGHFTMSLKVTTGMVHRRDMVELHLSRHIREMIAEMNVAYKPALVVMDGVEAFYEGGPMTGKRWNANLTLASKDRVAIDAVGVAALKMHGTTSKIEKRGIFEQTQIKRAVELGLGASSPSEIHVMAADEGSIEIAEELQRILRSQ
jgi:uncharacterized protein (DUF362 family)